MTDIEELRGRMIDWDRGAWCLAALAIVLDRTRDDAQADAAAQVLTTLGIDVGGADIGPTLASQLASNASAPLVQTAMLLSGDHSWDEQSDDALLAQGRGSAQAAALFERFVLPQLPGLAERFAAPGARMLDVGVGTAAMAVAYAETFPNLSVVGIDVMPRVLRLAAGVIAASSAADRVEVRQRDVGSLDESDGDYDLVWLPAPFLPPEPLRAGAANIRRVLRAGGWVMVGHGKFGNDPIEDAVNRFKTVAFGGTALDGDAAQALLSAAGLVDVHTMATPPGAPALTFGRAPD